MHTGHGNGCVCCARLHACVLAYLHQLSANEGILPSVVPLKGVQHKRYGTKGLGAPNLANFLQPGILHNSSPSMPPPFALRSGRPTSILQKGIRNFNLEQNHHDAE